jgi:hypothetical protein
VAGGRRRRDGGGGRVDAFWAVRHIGTISRTRTSTRQGPLIMSGPFRMVRNPLYLGNWMIWTGLVLASRLCGCCRSRGRCFALQYGTMVIWEEARLRSKFGASTIATALDVPRWVPAAQRPCSLSSPASLAVRGVQRARHRSWRSCWSHLSSQSKRSSADPMTAPGSVQDLAVVPTASSSVRWAFASWRR